jgi:23S rRNA (adenine2030-N6)-methyltransferase
MFNCRPSKAGPAARTMNYRHAYHAGNFADVVKHIVLLGVLEALARKPKGFCYLDTHAGTGRYDLGAGPAQRTGEAASGVLALRAAGWQMPALAQRYLEIVGRDNGDKPGAWRWYPGSPALAAYQLRPQDRAVLFELHPEDAKNLKRTFAGNRQVGVHEADGYRAVRPFLPPPEGRGVMLVDPPYEAPDEFKRVLDLLAVAQRAWRSGTFLLWYPIKDDVAVRRFQRRLIGTGIPKQLRIEMAQDGGEREEDLRGSGMIVVNPPWQLADLLRQTLPAVVEALSRAPAGEQVSSGQRRFACTIDWLVPE